MYLSYFGRLTFHVLFPLLYYVNSICLFYLTLPHNNILSKFTINNSRKKFLFSGLSIYIIIILTLFASETVSSRGAVAKQNNTDLILEQLAAENYVWVSPASLIRFQRIPTFYNNYNKYLDCRKIIPIGGWTVPSPHFYSILEYNSINDIYLALVERDDLHFLDSGLEHIKFIETFLKEHYDIEINYTPISEIKNIVVYRINKR